jgi:hypothetical protein
MLPSARALVLGLVQNVEGGAIETTGVGIALGTIIGFATGNLVLWAAMGVALGAGAGAMIQLSRARTGRR